MLLEGVAQIKVYQKRFFFFFFATTYETKIITLRENIAIN